MILAVADTHAVIWYLFKNPQLSAHAFSRFNRAVDTGNQIAVSSVTFVEIVYLLEKGRIPATTLEVIAMEMQKADALIAEVPLDLSISKAMASVSRAAVPDMPDRIIAATALHLGVPLISRDNRIQLSGIATVW